MTAVQAIRAGMTPRALEDLVRGHVREKEIAHEFAVADSVVKFLLLRWGLHYLSGRGKSNVEVALLPEGALKRGMGVKVIGVGMDRRAPKVVKSTAGGES